MKGSVNRVAESDELMDLTRALAPRILRNGPQAAAPTLQAVDRGLRMFLSEALEWEVGPYALS